MRLKRHCPPLFNPDISRDSPNHRITDQLMNFQTGLLMMYPKLKPGQKPGATATVCIAAGILLAGAAAIFSPTSRAADDKKAAPPKAALTVSTEQPSPTRLPIRLSANGTITAWQEAIVGSESNGLRLTEVRANVGDRVVRGSGSRHVCAGVGSGRSRTIPRRRA